MQPDSNSKREVSDVHVQLLLDCPAIDGAISAGCPVPSEIIEAAFALGDQPAPQVGLRVERLHRLRDLLQVVGIKNDSRVADLLRKRCHVRARHRRARVPRLEDRSARRLKKRRHNDKAARAINELQFLARDKAEKMDLLAQSQRLDRLLDLRPELAAISGADQRNHQTSLLLQPRQRFQQPKMIFVRPRHCRIKREILRQAEFPPRDIVLRLGCRGVSLRRRGPRDHCNFRWIDVVLCADVVLHPLRARDYRVRILAARAVLDILLDPPLRREELRKMTMLQIMRIIDARQRANLKLLIGKVDRIAAETLDKSVGNARRRKAPGRRIQPPQETARFLLHRDHGIALLFAGAAKTRGRLRDDRLVRTDIGVQPARMLRIGEENIFLVPVGQLPKRLDQADEHALHAAHPRRRIDPGIDHDFHRRYLSRTPRYSRLFYPARRERQLPKILIGESERILLVLREEMQRKPSHRFPVLEQMKLRGNILR